MRKYLEKKDYAAIEGTNRDGIRRPVFFGAVMRIRVKARNRSLEFEAAAEEKILYAGLRRQARLPYECASGTGGTCKARLVEGEIDDGWPGAPGRKFCREEKDFLMCQCTARTDLSIEVGGNVPEADPAAVWTASHHLGIEGRSNGGLLVGACITQAPHAFGSAVSAQSNHPSSVRPSEWFDAAIGTERPAVAYGHRLKHLSPRPASRWRGVGQALGKSIHSVSTTSERVARSLLNERRGIPGRQRAKENVSRGSRRPYALEARAGFWITAAICATNER